MIPLNLINLTQFYQTKKEKNIQIKKNKIQIWKKNLFKKKLLFVVVALLVFWFLVGSGSEFRLLIART